MADDHEYDVYYNEYSTLFYNGCLWTYFQKPSGGFHPVMGVPQARWME